MKYDYEIIRKKRTGISKYIRNKVCIFGIINVKIMVVIRKTDRKIDELLDEKSAWIEKVIHKNSISLKMNEDIILRHHSSPIATHNFLLKHFAESMLNNLKLLVFLHKNEKFRFNNFVFFD